MTLFNGNWVDRNNRRYYAKYTKNCGIPTQCMDPTPVKAVSDWLEAAGDTAADERTIAECFGSLSHGCQRSIYRDGHRGVITLHHNTIVKQFECSTEPVLVCRERHDRGVGRAAVRSGPGSVVGDEHEGAR